MLSLVAHRKLRNNYVLFTKQFNVLMKCDHRFDCDAQYVLEPNPLMGETIFVPKICCVRTTIYIYSDWKYKLALGSKHRPFML